MEKKADREKAKVLTKAFLKIMQNTQESKCDKILL